MGKGRARDLEGRLVALVGGSGFFGTHLAQELLARGARLRVCSRHPERAFRLKPLGALGQVQLVAVDVTKPHTLEVALTGVDAVVNLVGAFAGDLGAVQGKGAGRVAAIARAAGASAFVHVSAIGADAESDVAYARTKAEGEAAVLAAFPEATILRPSILFGEDDKFVTMFAGLIASLPVLPVFGPTAKLQPVFVDDAAEAVGNVLAAPAAHAGRTYEIAGPEQVTMADLNRRIAKAEGRSRVFLDLPDGISAAIATFTGWLPGAPITRDQWRLLEKGNVASGALPGLKELGVHPRPLELFLDRWMVRYRKYGRFGTKTRFA
ncbi:complex I NDUFA9 subunit family protein [Novosphingobium sp. KCTC 2891]|uniref:complex I NDUFA9 subunit family protein n=1 Tax=Novosphingobium sp. KCTC 2891 TaxID=2989730 RepID=UPI002221E5A7|nr:complex I NDUFA9 subunit family protein [Novosphingobium sp. KCTC 2891]MCW1383036.1 complex I NDUFA9 subunit family protein [Novosphingobium sp. KCTC 2891]